MSYELVGWENKPSTKTAVGATNLKHMDRGIKDAHDFIDSLPEWLKEGGKPNYTAEEVGAYSKEQTVQLLYTKANAIKNSAQGETILTTDSANAPLVDMTVYGKSKQNQYEGNQLLNITDGEETKNGITVTRKNGIVTVKGTPITTDGYTMFDIGNTNECSENDYILSMNQKIVGIGLSFLTEPSGQLNSTMADSLTVRSQKSIAIKNDVIKLNVSNSYSYSNVELKYMLNQGTTTLPWEPYVGNTPSPSIDYPQEVTSHGDKGSIEYGLYGKNLYIGRYYYTSYSKGIVYVVNDSNVVLPYNPNTYSYGVGKIVPCKAGVTYSISVNKMNDNATIRYAEYPNVDSVYSVDNKISHKDNNSANSLTYTAQTNGVLLIAISGTWVSGGHLIHVCTEDEEVQVEIGSTVTEYEAPKEPQPLTILTPNGLRGIPLGTTIPDAIKNSEIHMRGVWFDESEQQYYISDTREYGRGKDVQRIVAGVLDGTQSAWVASTIAQVNKKYVFGYEVIIPTFYTHALDTFAMCDRFLLQTDNYDCKNYPNKMYFSSNVSPTNIICVNNSLFETQDNAGFQKFFSENPTTIYAILETPIETDIPSEEMAQYNALMMNYPNTTILNDEGTYTEMEYVSDTKRYIDNKFKELEANVTSAVAQLL